MKPASRDERGWRIPRAGTRSALIYAGMIAGKTTRAISDAIGVRRRIVTKQAHDIRNPDAKTTRQALYRAAAYQRKDRER